jgi:hypothetical protein
MRRLIVVTLVCIALAGLAGLTGCASQSGPSSPSAPSIEQARKVLETAYPGSKIVDFRKLNGEMKVVEGQPTYVYHFLAGMELPAGIGWQHENLPYGLSAGFVSNGPGQAHAFGAQVDPIPAGATGVSKGTITFRETERGWLTNDRPVADEGYCPPKTPPQACYKKLGWDKLN